MANAFMTPEAIAAHECTEAYLRKLQEYMRSPSPSCDAEMLERNRVLRAHARAAISKISEHMP